MTIFLLEQNVWYGKSEERLKFGKSDVKFSIDNERISALMKFFLIQIFIYTSESTSFNRKIIFLTLGKFRTFPTLNN